VRTHLRLASIAAILAVAASGCAGRSNAYSLGDESATIDEVEAAVAQLAEAQQVELSNGVADGETVRAVLGAMIRASAIRELLAANGDSVTDEDRAVVTRQYDAESGFDALGQDLQELLIEVNAADVALARVPAPAADGIEAAYSSNPARLGAMCLRHVLVADEGTARKVVAELKGGADVAEVVARWSTEPGAAERAGALEGPDGACIRLADYQSQFDAEFVAGALGVTPDAPSDPVKTQFGWHVIVARPYGEVADSLAALLRQAPGEMLLGGWLVTARVDVASRYGRWNPAQGAIVPL
jgi:parvulin-like peptidyl-prolyl isomerase